jgi:hypothetical protein
MSSPLRPPDDHLGRIAISFPAMREIIHLSAVQVGGGQRDGTLK